MGKQIEVTVLAGVQQHERIFLKAGKWPLWAISGGSPTNKSAETWRGMAVPETASARTETGRTPRQRGMKSGGQVKEAVRFGGASQNVGKLYYMTQFPHDHYLSGL